MRVQIFQHVPFEGPGSLTVFHWHGETFTLPPGCERLASTPNPTLNPAPTPSPEQP